ncbi:cadherin EGF LAG seven-pass G-type receptor 3-like [Uloborus diversus]|uniref:cadherin EGF LAG seven-pass G-type receptor 3-like n=1 Tax=Uloborus diversus TaxID=327109 RepID=UPI002409E54C|nr:cadherin EGF LAG seven-pass G-type receptor 3-like [Uloborus diversus]
MQAKEEAIPAANPGKLVFRPLMHQPRIYAGAPAGVHVTTVHAYDPDHPRMKVEYSMPKVLDSQTFIVDEKTGNLTTATAINKTVGETYQVMVSAVSEGASDLEHLQIAVTEFNQFAPRFEARGYTAAFHSEASLNTQVLQVKAYDPDTAPHNAEIYYKMDQNETSTYFSLDSLTGALVLTQPINRTPSPLRFGIFAEDGGSPKRWDYVPVTVVLKTLSAPRDVIVNNITYESADACLKPPEYGKPQGYAFIYTKQGSGTSFIVNDTVHNSKGKYCRTIDVLPNATYDLRAEAWNYKEQGQSSGNITFHTAENWCDKKPCSTGICQPLASEPWFECYCENGFYGPTCEYFNPCSRNPCSKNGRCLNTTHNEYVCICDEDYSGPNCGSYNPCERKNQCHNGGQCKLTTNQSFVCLCPDGFYGQKCKHVDLCATSPCLNGATCEHISETNFICICPPGFTGLVCDEEIDECLSQPCANGSTCLDGKGNVTCLCPPGFSGYLCNIADSCPADVTDTDRGVLYWNATEPGTVAKIMCPLGASDFSTTKAYAYRNCSIVNRTIFWEEVDTTECKGKEFIVADEIAESLQVMTRDAKNLNTETLESAAQAIETISSFAKKDKKLAEDMVQVISNVMNANGSVVSEEKASLTENLRQVVDDLASNVELKRGEVFEIETYNLHIKSVDWHPDEESESESSEEHLEFEAPNSNDISAQGIFQDEQKPTTIEDVIKNLSTVSPFPLPKTTEKTKVPVVQVFVPKEALQEAHRQLEKNVRVKFVVYYNDILFQSKPKTTPSSTESAFDEDKSNDFKPLPQNVNYKTPVLQISVGNVSIKNLNKPLIYILPMETDRKPVCVYWDSEERFWSTDGIITNYTAGKVICQSSHMTAFSVLLDVMPSSKVNERHHTVLSIISYTGSGLSIVGLSLTLLTYSLFGCLNRDHPGKILICLCLSLLLMNAMFLLGAFDIEMGGHLCAAIALSLHYLVLTSLSWMCVEAVNMYQLLVQVFASSETHFMLKRCLYAWGIPLIIVSLTGYFRFGSYCSNMDVCMLTSKDPWIYYATFLGPACAILVVNFVIFVLVSRVIFAPRLAHASGDNQPAVTTSQVRGAFTVMILLGITWVFGTLAIGKVKVAFQYLFCICNSFQGFLVFLVRCLLYSEARNAWAYLFKHGKLKRHRGVLPPATVSFSTNSHGRHAGQTNSSGGRADCEGMCTITLENEKLKRSNGSVNRREIFPFEETMVKEVLNSALPRSYPIHNFSNVNQNFCQDFNLNSSEPHKSMIKDIQDSFASESLNRRSIIPLESFQRRHPTYQQSDEPLSMPANVAINAAYYCDEKDNEIEEETRYFPVATDRWQRDFSNVRMFEELPTKDFRKERSASVGGSCSFPDVLSDNYVSLGNPAMAGFKALFANMRVQGEDQVSKDKRSLSVDHGSPNIIQEGSAKRKGPGRTRRHRIRNHLRFVRRSSIVLEQDEEQSDEKHSSSTDVDDSPPPPSANVARRRWENASRKAMRNTGEKRSHLARTVVDKDSSLQVEPPVSPKRNNVDIVK